MSIAKGIGECRKCNLPMYQCKCHFNTIAKPMSKEDLTPIEEFIEKSKKMLNEQETNIDWIITDKQQGYHDGYLSGISECVDLMNEYYLAKEKAHREKYCHTKEDVDNLLKQQREICAVKMKGFCEIHNYKDGSHVVLYAPRP